ncbi:MAG: phenylalanine--tRNA ligase subunit alpha [Candidatus Nanoarchaeia archaeon]
MDLKTLVQTLHPLERAVVKHLDSSSSDMELVDKTGLQPVEVVRALQWLQNKEVLTISKETAESIHLGPNGQKALEEGLPERRFLEAVSKKGLKIGDLGKAAKLGVAEVNVCLGLLKKRGHVSLDKGVAAITPEGKKALSDTSLEERFLRKLEMPVPVSSLSDEDKYGYDAFKKRKGLINVKSSTRFTYGLTDLGKQLSKAKISDDMIDRLTSDMLKIGSWKGKPIRRYDVSINVPSVTGGKRHFVKQAVDYTKKIWLEMGFKEMEGPLLQTSFWNFDALFTAQDHPVREMQDTFFIAEPASGDLPDKRLVGRVKHMHEEGGELTSTGWGGTWTKEHAQRNVLRTHTTALSAQTLASLKEEDLPAKFFSVGRCFRNETLDWCHLFEFNQTEGIVVDPKGNFQHLLGYLKQFYQKIGFEKVRFRPAFFPYTEPSVEIDVYHPEHQTWIELGGAGIFRPEVVVPLLGKDVPVLAWGQGLGRIMSDYYSITDIRDLYKNDLKQIRDMKIWSK